MDRDKSGVSACKCARRWVTPGWVWRVRRLEQSDQGEMFGVVARRMSGLSRMSRILLLLLVGVIERSWERAVLMFVLR